MCPKCKLIELDPNDDLQSQLEMTLFDLPPPILAGTSITQKGSATQIDVLFNPNGLHSMPMALALMANGLLGAKSC
jgi:hypothetical protein